MARTKLFINRAPPKVLGIPKLRHKEEKKKVIKLCVKKLKTIEDTESLLCKSVLIVNTIRKLRQYNQQYVSAYDVSEDGEEAEGLERRDEWVGQSDNMACCQYDQEL